MTVGFQRIRYYRFRFGLIVTVTVVFGWRVALLRFTKRPVIADRTRVFRFAIARIPLSFRLCRDFCFVILFVRKPLLGRNLFSPSRERTLAAGFFATTSCDNYRVTPIYGKPYVGASKINIRSNLLQSK